MSNLNEIDRSSSTQKGPVTSLRLISYNIQTGIHSTRPRDYLLNGWQHLLPHKMQGNNLDNIADLLKDFDIVALQEVDSGSLRTGFVNQVEYLAKKSHFPYWHSQCNRNFGRFAQHSNGMLSRLQPTVIDEHKLPGFIPGRGAICLSFGESKQPLILVMLHLALGKRARHKQLNYVTDLIVQYEHVIVMGDLNCRLESLLESRLLTDTPLIPVNFDKNTFPSWAPKRNIDHILVSPSMCVDRVEILPFYCSDHLPIAIELSVPSKLLLCME